MATYTATAEGGDRLWRTEATWDLGSEYPDGDDLAVLDVSGGDVTLGDHAACLSFDASAYEGTFDSATFGMIVGGDFKFNGATAFWTNVANFILAVNGSGDLENAHYTRAVKELVIAGTPTLTADFYTRKVTVTGTVSSDVAELLFIYAPGAAWWGNQTGVVNCDVWVANASAAPGNAITLNGTDLTISSSLSDKTLTLDADVNVGAGSILLASTQAGDDITLTGTGVLTAAAVTLDAFDDAGASCTLVLDGETHSIGSIAGVTDDDGANALELGTCTINDMVAGIDGTNIDTVTAVDAVLRGNGTSTIKGVDISAGGVIRCYGFVDGGGNSGDIRFGGAGSLLMMGVGS